MEWAKEGTPEYSLVVADSQTAGRGRLDRNWVTNKGEGLAFSIVLRPKPDERIPQFSALGGIAVCETLIQTFHLPATIKWPNDVLIGEKKVCGILAETQWDGSPNLILGIGINVGKGSLPGSDQLNFPATTLETEMGHPIDRISILTEILKSLVQWRGLIGTSVFLAFWKDHLAFIEEPVRVTLVGENIQGILKGISEVGNLQIQIENGTTIDVEMGDVQLHPISRSIK
jgi:BirA family biotin operon repressor/biotin-[acetyl-CoA-carboxylase] ligase